MEVNNLKIYRHARGYTQKEVADKLGISEASYNRKENNKISVSVKDINVILEMFEGVSYDDLFRRKI